MRLYYNDKSLDNFSVDKIITEFNLFKHFLKYCWFPLYQKLSEHAKITAIQRICCLSLRSPGSQLRHVGVLLFLLSLGSLGFGRHCPGNVREGNSGSNIQELLVKLLLLLQLQFLTESVKLGLQFILIKLLN